MASRGPRWKHGSRVQTLVFDRSAFSVAEAKSWARSHGFRAPKADTTDKTIRLRQEPPSRFVEGHFATMSLDTGVQAVVAEPKQRAETGGSSKGTDAVSSFLKRRGRKGSRWDPIGDLLGRSK